METTNRVQKSVNLFYPDYNWKYEWRCYHLGMRVAGFVLVGGQSSRMGRDKARLQVGSRLLVERIAEKIAVAAGNAVLIGEPERYADLKFECLPDLHPGLGPLSGMETALASGRGDLNLIVACDMPLLKSVWLADLIKAGADQKTDCVVARDDDGEVHPLCAVYKTSCLPAVQRAIETRNLKMTDLLDALKTKFFPIEGTILNTNSPEEWLAWQRTEALVLEGAESV